MKEIPLTQGKFALVDDEDYEYLSQWKWYARKDRNTFYVTRTKINGNNKFQIHLHREVLCLSRDNEFEVDHINGDGLDNRKTNLRICSHKDNCRNRKKYSTNSSGYRGVTWKKSINKWVAKIGVSGKWIHLGVYTDILEAAKAYEDAAQKYFGNFSSSRD